jgi:hypothetical protein
MVSANRIWRIEKQLITKIIINNCTDNYDGIIIMIMMGRMRSAYRTLSGKHEGKYPISIPRRRLDEGNEMYLVCELDPTGFRYYNMKIVMALWFHNNLLIS